MGSIPITINDERGTRVRDLEEAFRVKFSPKLGTVVISDLRTAEIPASFPVTASLEGIDLSMNTAVGVKSIELSNRAGESTIFTDEHFFISRIDSRVSLHTKS